MATYNVIWKWEGDDNRFKDISNVYTFKWIPQQDLLAHPNVRLFVNQGGQQSMEEAIDRQVPMLVLPFFADQETNAKKVEYLGIGRKLLQKDMNSKNFEEIILEILNNPR